MRDSVAFIACYYLAVATFFRIRAPSNCTIFNSTLKTDAKIAKLNVPCCQCPFKKKVLKICARLISMSETFPQTGNDTLILQHHNKAYRLSVERCLKFLLTLLKKKKKTRCLRTYCLLRYLPTDSKKSILTKQPPSTQCSKQ